MLSPTELITHYSLDTHYITLKYTATKFLFISLNIFMVHVAGIEPTTFGLEGHCSSTELHALFFIHTSSLLNQKIDIIILAATYSHTSTRCTTISICRLNFCVRNGNRCTPTVLTTKTITSILSSLHT